MITVSAAGSGHHRLVQRAHAIRKYRERYDVQFSEFDYRALCRRVFRFLTGHSDGDVEGIRIGLVMFWIHLGSGLSVIAVWDECTQQIATFIPLACTIPPCHTSPPMTS